MSLISIVPPIVNGDLPEEIPFQGFPLVSICEAVEWADAHPGGEFPEEISPDYREMFGWAADLAREAG